MLEGPESNRTEEKKCLEKKCTQNVSFIGKKNPDIGYEVQVKMEEARRKMQEKVSVDSAIRRDKEAEIAEQKRLKKIEEWENHKLGKGTLMIFG